MAPDKSVPATVPAFAARTTVEQVEEGLALAPGFDADGLIPCITADAHTGDVLMLGYMNGEALQRTIATGEAHYWSRKPPAPLAQGRNQWPRPEGCRDAHRRRPGRRLAARPGRWFGRQLSRRIPFLLL